MSTLTSRDICERLHEKIGSFVMPAFDLAPAEFKTLYKNRVQSFPGGFRRIELVPKVLMVKRIGKDSSGDPEVAVAIMKNWYRAKKALRDKTIALLKSLGYDCTEPDFENDAITYRSLSPAHVHAEGSAYFFSPGPDLGDYDKLELTVMAALLGWFPDPADETAPQ